MSDAILNINSETGDIVSLQSFNYEEMKTFQFKVQATDSGVPPLSSNVTVNVFILDENDNSPAILAPYSEHDSVNSESIPYSAEAGYFVAKIRAVDADSGYNALLSYHLSEPKGNNLFRVGTSTGEIRTKRRMNDNDLKTHPLVVLVSDNGEPSLSATVSIDVVVVESTADIQTQFRHVPINEESFSDLNLYLLIAIVSLSVIFLLSLISLIAVKCHRTDSSFSRYSAPMITTNPDGSWSYSKSTQQYDVCFSSDTLKKTGDIVSLQSFNYEEIKTFQFKVQATDSGVPPLSSNVTVNVLILDENDNSPAILAPYSEHGSVNSESIPYSAEAGYFVAKIRAVDADSGYNALLSYHLSEPKSNNLFRVGTSTGEIRTKRRMSDYDLKTHPLVVLVSDNGEPSLSATVSIDVVVVESTADIQTQFRNVPINEESFSDLNLYLLIAIVSLSVIFLLSLISLIAVKFHRTDSSFSRYSAPMITTHPDGSWSYSKSTQQYDVCFSSDTLKSDMVVFPAQFPQVDAELISINGGDTFTRTQTLPNKEKVSDVNDNAPRFMEPVINVYIKENSPTGSVIFTINAFDSDLDSNAKLAYTLLNSSPKNIPISPVVNINSETGDIVSLQSFNYEETKTFQFKVQATDSGVPPLSSNVTVNVFILDENDNSPAILAPYSEHGSVNSESIPYSAEAGYFVAKIRAVDADSGYNALLSYHLSEPKGNNLFRIGTSTGEIRTKRRMSDNDLKTHPLVVLVSDNGEPSLSATVSIDVVVVESTADIQTQFRHVPIKEESFSDLNLYLLIAIVSVSVIFLLSLISLIAVKCHRTDSSFSRYSAPMITTHPDGSWSYSKSTQQYDVCFSSDTLKSDMVVFPAQFPQVDAELISINGGDTFTRTQTLPNKEQVSSFF
ncbi:hypothetical protein Q8A73_010797 [Channa argus]|nr:hypothetical protein Q8A73_010797 [Channa argus]